MPEVFITIKPSEYGYAVEKALISCGWKQTGSGTGFGARDLLMLPPDDALIEAPHPIACNTPDI